MKPKSPFADTALGMFNATLSQLSPADRKRALERFDAAVAAWQGGTPTTGIEHILSYMETVDAALGPLSTGDRKVVLDEMIDAAAHGFDPTDRVELLAELHGLLTDEQKAEQKALSLDAALEACGLMPVVLDIERRAKDLLLPSPTTASNVETLMMSYGYWFTQSPDDVDHPRKLEFALRAALYRKPESVERCRKAFELFVKKDAEFMTAETAAPLLDFGRNWARSAFARLEVGHKLAASLCLTDIPDDVDVKAPWEAWSLVVPDGLLGELARIWCRGATPVFVVKRDGSFDAYVGSAACSAPDALLRALVRGACFALSDPDDFRKERRHPPTARSASKRSGPPDLQQARFLLSAPVKIDFREHIRDVVSGKSHASPTVQFLVRGHGRMQAHGPHHSLRKPIWVPPFWKGPEESRILLRQHTLDEPKKETDP